MLPRLAGFCHVPVGMLKLARGNLGFQGSLQVSKRKLIIENLQQLGAQLEELAALALELPGDNGCLADDDDFSRALVGLQIDLLGARALAARAEREEVLWQVVAVRSAEMRSTAAALVISGLGYQALPDPNPLLIDNEGPIGHHRALELMLGLAGYFGASEGQNTDQNADQIADKIGDNWGDGGFSDRDAIARRIFSENFRGP